VADPLGDNPANGALTLGTPAGISVTGPVRLRGPIEGGGSDVRRVLPVVRNVRDQRKRNPRPGTPGRATSR
jgi:hypothetical protein